MRTISRRLLLSSGLTAGALLLPHAATAQAYPDKPIRFIAPFPAGSATDGLARFLGQRMSEAMGQPIIIDNRPGANGIVGAQAAAQSPPDGYTVFVTTNSTHSANINLYKQLPYDPVRDFAPVARLMRIPVVFVVRRDSPMRSLQDLIAAARQQPGKLSFGSGNTIGRGTTELLKAMAGFDMLHVPYRGTPQALADLVASQVDMVAADPSSALGLIQAGTVRPLAVTGAARVPALPDVPTVAESGVTGFELTAWIGAFAPARTPADIVARLNREFLAAASGPAAAAYFEKIGGIADPSTPDELGRFVVSETAKWARIVEVAKIEKE
ncbi:tripartite tricarboxylate transporter substrate binding protein [Vineibacter terrae]|uniref:Bug family tripartite tricarboxylate transporter substrate binding protein n=1 Tax=Vineibacter terrae TaxID=2586908 RepID=UPI002E36EB42|nr:tripartite tricarboxylate transporter substrate binding protein [Vineibacter terrae]HEX2887710.1 tripartite tricarboxylate transporter substrate binding protein [Vineibacter terrae]